MRKGIFRAALLVSLVTPASDIDARQDCDAHRTSRLLGFTNHGRDDEGARERQAFLSSLRNRAISDADVERFRCLLGDCTRGRSARQALQMAGVDQVSQLAARSVHDRRP